MKNLETKYGRVNYVLNGNYFSYTKEIIQLNYLFSSWSAKVLLSKHTFPLAKS